MNIEVFTVSLAEFTWKDIFQELKINESILLVLQEQDYGKNGKTKTVVKCKEDYDNAIAHAHKNSTNLCVSVLLPNKN